MAWAVSGSVSLELMMEALPTVILYKLNRVDLMIARPFIKAKYITLVNLLADAELMPEYLTVKDVSDELVTWARTWLDDPIARARATANLAALRHEVARPGASQRAADRDHPVAERASPRHDRPIAALTSHASRGELDGDGQNPVGGADRAAHGPGPRTAARCKAPDRPDEPLRPSPSRSPFSLPA